MNHVEVRTGRAGDYQTMLIGEPEWSAGSAPGTGVAFEFIDDRYIESAIRFWTRQSHGHERLGGLRTVLVPAWSHHGPAEIDAEPAAATMRAVEVIGGIAERLDIPVEVVLNAASIKRRTYQAWVAKPSTTPRLESQGRLWELAQAVEDIEEVVDDAATWIKVADHLPLLKAGRLDELVEAAIAERRPERIAELVAPIYTGEHTHEPSGVPADTPRRAKAAARAPRSR